MKSVYFKELHNEQEYHCPTIYGAGAAVVSTITSGMIITDRTDDTKSYYQLIITIHVYEKTNAFFFCVKIIDIGKFPSFLI